MNVKKLNAASGEKMAPSASPRVETVVPVSTAMVDDCLLCGKARNESRRGAPVGKAQRREHGRNDPCAMPASILAELSATTLRRMSKDCKTR